MANVLITGGSRGIGRATALLCAKSGWSVAVNYVRDERAANDTAEAVRATGSRAITIMGDVASEADVVAKDDRVPFERPVAETGVRLRQYVSR